MTTDTTHLSPVMACALEGGIKTVKMMERNMSEPKPFTIVQRNHRLLTGVEVLLKPDWHSMTTEDRLLHACLCAYAKHHLNNDDIGWDKLGDILHNAICEAVGDEAFVEWGERLTP